jgi:hypothetical protein
MTSQRANVILGVILILLVCSFAVGYVRKMQVEEIKIQAMHNLGEVAKAVHSCHDMDKCFPPACDRFAAITYPVPLHVYLLPFVAQDEIYKTFLTEGKGREGVAIPLYLAPADPSAGNGEGVQNYAANLRVFSTKGQNTNVNEDMPALAAIEPGVAKIPSTFQITGTSNTIMLATKLALCSHGGSRYAAPPTSPYAAFFGQNAAQSDADPTDPQATFQLAPKGSECLTSPLMAQSFDDKLLVAMVDASVRKASSSVGPDIWNQVMQPLRH